MKKILILLSIITSLSAYAGQILNLTQEQQLGLQAEVARSIKTAKMRCTQIMGEDQELRPGDLDYMVKQLSVSILEGKIDYFEARDPYDGVGTLALTSLKKSQANGVVTESYDIIYINYIEGTTSYNDFYLQFSKVDREVGTLYLIKSGIEFKAHCKFVK